MTERPNVSMNLQADSEIKAIVMRRVHTIHLLQMLLSTTAFSIGVFVVALWGIGREVWVNRVLQNMPSLSNFSAVYRFYFSAFMDTRFIVQALSIVALGAFVWFIWNALSMLQQASLGSASRFRSQ